MVLVAICVEVELTVVTVVGEKLVDVPITTTVSFEYFVIVSVMEVASIRTVSVIP